MDYAESTINIVSKDRGITTTHYRSTVFKLLNCTLNLSQCIPFKKGYIPDLNLKKNICCKISITNNKIQNLNLLTNQLKIGFIIELIFS